MDAEPPINALPPVVKPLLLEALGKPFLAYVLGATEDEITEWLTAETDELGSFQQNHALQQLHIVLHVQGINEDAHLRQLNLSHILGTYQEASRTTLVNVIRMIATSEIPASVEPGTLEDALAVLVRDVYPLYLLPETDTFFPRSSISVLQHPMHEQFESLVLNDDVIATLFPEEDKYQGKFGYALRSTQQGGGIQLSMLAETLIASGWSAARMNSTTEPTLDEHIQATLTQLDVIRKALAGKRVEVPVRVSLTGVLLESEEPLDLGWGVLRKVDERDRHLVPKSIEGQLAGTGSDGVNVTIDYSGNVILDTTIEYKVVLKKLDLEKDWPKELRGFDLVTRRVESIQLGALLSQDFNANELVTVLPTWYYAQEPFSHSYNISWRDPRRSRAFVPKQLDRTQAPEWQRFTLLVEANRTKYVDVAIRRTLRAAAERQDFADVLVDAIIAWENLFGSRQGELKLRIAGSLAWLLKDELTDREAFRSELSKLYDMRSDVVHGNKEHDPRELVPRAQRALEIAVSALKILFTSRSDLLRDLKTGDVRSNRLLMGG